jgi:hypothetical protein
MIRGRARDLLLIGVVGILHDGPRENGVCRLVADAVAAVAAALQ